MEVVDEWWKEVDPTRKLESPVLDVAELFVRKGIATDEEFARKILYKNIDKRASVVTCEEFNQIFCKNIFKDALIEVTSHIERVSAGASEAPLTLKLGLFQRHLIEPGLQEKSDDKTKDARAIMGALFQLQAKNDNSLRYLKYSDFASDPLGRIAKQRAEELAKIKQFDNYTKAI